MVIGEAAKGVSSAYRDEHASIPWRLMAGMRDRLIHRYNEVDLDEVWNTASMEIPRLLKDLEALAASP